jgi:hypothetical protein
MALYAWPPPGHCSTQATIVNLGFWAIGVSLVNAGSHQFPRALSLLGVFPAFHLFAGLLGPVLGTALETGAMMVPFPRDPFSDSSRSLEWPRSTGAD